MLKRGEEEVGAPSEEVALDAISREFWRSSRGAKLYQMLEMSRETGLASSKIVSFHPLLKE